MSVERLFTGEATLRFMYQGEGYFLGEVVSISSLGIKLVFSLFDPMQENQGLKHIPDIANRLIFLSFSGGGVSLFRLNYFAREQASVIRYCLTGEILHSWPCAQPYESAEEMHAFVCNLLASPGQQQVILSEDRRGLCLVPWPKGKKFRALGI